MVPGGSPKFVFRNGTSSARTRYAAYPGEERQVLIKPSAARKAGFVVLISASVAYVEISGLILDGTNVIYNVVKLGRNSEYQYPQRNRIINNEIRFTTGSSAVSVAGPNEIIGNKVHSTPAYGIYASGPAGLVEGNTIYNCAGYGIHLYDFTPIKDWVIRKNILHSNGKLYKGSPKPAVIITRGKHRFYNNIIYGNYAGGVEVWGGASDTLVANNTVYGNKTYGILVNTGILRARIINNLVWGNGGEEIDNNGSSTVLRNNMTTDPKVVSVTNRDFRLQSSSPAINKGMTLVEVPKDIKDIARPQGGAFDIGAYEFR